MQNHRKPAIANSRPQSAPSAAGWRAVLRDLLLRRSAAPTVFQRCLAVHIAYAGARTALS
jgi:hypothetical protein